MNTRKILLITLAFSAVILLFWLWSYTSKKPASTGPASRLTESATIPPGVAKAVPPEREFNDQQGLSGQQIYEKVMAEMEAKGGALKIWKADMQRATKEALEIKTVKMTPQLAVYLDKVNAALWGGSDLFSGEGIIIDNILDAKRAAVIDKKSGSLAYYTIPSKAVLYKDMVYFAPAATTKNGLGEEIQVPNDFSKGVALKMNEKNHVKRFEWDFHLIPPADGVVGIATETE